MGGRAKIRDIYSSEGEVVRTTTPAFVKEHPEIYKPQLYEKCGAVDEDEVSWRVDTPPIITPTKLTPSARKLFNIFEGIAEGVDKRSSIDADEAIKIIRSYRVRHTIYIDESLYSNHTTGVRRYRTKEMSDRYHLM